MTDSVIPVSTTRVEQGFKKAAAAVPLIFGVVDVLSAGRNTLAVSSPDAMSGSMCPIQEAFGVVASTAGVLVALGGVCFIAMGIRDLVQAKTNEKRVTALLKIAMGLAFLVGGVIYSGDWAALVHGNAAVSGQLGPMVPYVIYASYGTSFMLALRGFIPKVNFRAEFKKQIKECGESGLKLKDWLLYDKETELKAKLDMQEDPQWKKARSEWLELRTGFTYDEIAAMDKSGVQKAVLDQNFDAVIGGGVSLIANIIGATAMDIAAFWDQHSSLYHLSASQAAIVSPALFITAATLFFPVDTNLVKKIRENGRAALDALQEKWERAFKKQLKDEHKLLET